MISWKNTIKLQRAVCFLMSFAVIMSLCGCVSDESATEPSKQVQSIEESMEETAMPTVSTEPTVVPTESTEAATKPTKPVTEPTTEPSAPLHSGLYLPECSQEQMIEYFSEVVLSMEYSSGDGDASLVQKWLSPIYYRISGIPTDEDLLVLNSLTSQLNSIEGFPGIYPAEDGAPENFTITFLKQEDLNASFSDAVNGEYAFGAVQFWYYTATNEIHTGRIGYSADVEQSIRNSVIQEEIINALGLNDTVLRTDSIVYQYSDDNITLSDVDMAILKLLYHPDIQPGMDYVRCCEVIEQLYY